MTDPRTRCRQRQPTRRGDRSRPRNR